MAATTKISWTDATFNPWIGCTKIAPGCEHCYAWRDMDKRRGRVKWGPNGTRSRTSDDYWRDPAKWNKRAEREGKRLRVFCASLADVFEDWQGRIQDARGRDLWYSTDQYRIMEPDDGRPGWAYNHKPVTMDALRADLFRLIDRTPHLDWILLTKRPENIRRMWPETALEKYREQQIADHMYPASFREIPGIRASFRKNVRLLYSASDQTTLDAGVPHLLACADLCPMVGLSLEPLLAEVDLGGWFQRGDSCADCGEKSMVHLNAYFGPAWYASLPPLCSRCGGTSKSPIHWVIVGAESGPNRRPMRQEWAESILDQCRAAGVPCFMKQMEVGGKVTDNPAEFPARLRVQEWPA